jgi:protein SCO1/2
MGLLKMLCRATRHAPRATFLLFLLLLALPCQSFAEPARYQRSVESYTIPDVVLTNQDGDKVRLKALLESGDPVAVDFIYATCTTICPILSAGYANLQRKLGSETQKVHLVSITIDPENDTPPVLKEYLGKYSAKPGWTFLTGSRRDIERVMTAFDAYFRDKMDHKPLTFIRSPKDGQWIRLYGLLSGIDFVDEYKLAGN